MPLRRSLAFACFVSAALPAPCALAFEKFTYVQTGALGFCPPIGAVFAAEVVQEAPGRYIAAVSILEAAPADAAGGSCLQLRAGLPAGTCARERKLAPRLLVGAEADRLEGRLEALFAQLEPGPAESCGLWDTCLEERVDLDGIYATSGACGPWLLDRSGLDLLHQTLEALRPPLTLAANGDTNGDGRRDLTDAVHLLQHLFLGGPPPVEARCDPDLRCSRHRTLVLANGDVNADWRRDGADAVALLEWLFRSGEAPAPICACLGGPACPPAACPEGGVCIPLGPRPLCTSELATCEEVRGVYELLVGTEATCHPAIGCHVLQGHCGIGLGGCAHPLSRTIRQEHLDALAARFVELGGLESCPSGVCDCAPSPPGASCQGARCVIEE